MSSDASSGGPSLPGLATLIAECVNQFHIWFNLRTIYLHHLLVCCSESWPIKPLHFSLCFMYQLTMCMWKYKIVKSHIAVENSWLNFVRPLLILHIIVIQMQWHIWKVKKWYGTERLPDKYESGWGWGRWCYYACAWTSETTCWEGPWPHDLASPNSTLVECSAHACQTSVANLLQDPFCNKGLANTMSLALLWL